MESAQALRAKTSRLAEGHFGIDEQTLEIRAVEGTSRDVGDAPILPEQLSRVPAEQRSASVAADRVYAITAWEAAAVIPTRKNAMLWKAITAGVAAL